MNRFFLTIAAMLTASAMLFADPVTGSSTENMEGQGNPFTNGYNYSFSADKGEVTITFESLEDYVGLVAYLWNYTSGFAERQMDVNGQVATTTLHNQPAGTVLDFACKFAYAGGMSVTKRFQYTVPQYEGGDTGDGGDTGNETIYWSNWMGDGAGGGIYNEKYKVQDVNGVSPVNIQQPGWAAEPGIYVTFPAAVSSVSVASTIDGAGAVLFLSAFENEYTDVVVECADGQTFKFMVYYVDGIKAITSLHEQTLTPARKVMRNGQVLIERDGVYMDMQGRLVK